MGFTRASFPVSFPPMTQTISMPIWVFVLMVLFAAVTFASHFLFPSVRWFFRKRAERVIARVNQRLQRPIEPFKLARRYDMIQRLIYDPEVTQAIVDHARKEKIPENVAFEKARRYAREIVPGFSATAYFSFGIRLARWLSKSLYRIKLGTFDRKRLEEIDPDATVIFVINHRSNMDYVLVTYLASNAGALSYAVGEWARVWPLSAIIRAMGAYFIRRRSRGALYRKVLARYVQMATRGGVSQAVFPEGGLSLNGLLAAPRMGLLNYVVDSFDPEVRDVIFVPVALNYDRVLEDRTLIAAANRKGHRFRAGLGAAMRNVLRQVWLRLTGRYRRFGSAAVSFGDPLSLRGFAGDAETIDLEPLAEELMQRIGAIVPVLPVPLICWIIREKGSISRTGLEIAMGHIARVPGRSNLHLPRDNRGYAAEAGLGNLTRRRILTLNENGEYSVRAGQEDLLQFYANSIGHLMPLEALDYSAGAK